MTGVLVGQKDSSENVHLRMDSLHQLPDLLKRLGVVYPREAA
jgi:hypothetical protein